MAGSADDPQLLHVTVSLGGFRSSVPDGAGHFDSVPVPVSEWLPAASATVRTSLPDSILFAGLAGTLSLAIDTSNGRPLVEGIALAPRETLRFAAGNQNVIRGIQGQIAIQLDF